MEAIKQKVTEITVAYNTNQIKSDRPKITSTTDALEHLIGGYDMNTIGIQEQFVVMYMTQGNDILGIYRASVGGLTGTTADIRLILAVALKIGATAIIVSHNHPSGNMHPSKADEGLTKKMAAASLCMDIRLLDHLVIHPNGKDYYSFAEEGLL